MCPSRPCRRRGKNPDLRVHGVLAPGKVASLNPPMPRHRPVARARTLATRASAIDDAIRTIRGERVISDADLAKIYGVETRVLNQPIRRNREKWAYLSFPRGAPKLGAGTGILPVKWHGRLAHACDAQRRPRAARAIMDVLQRIMALLEPTPVPPDLPAREMGFHATLKAPASSSGPASKNRPAKK